VDLPWSSAPYRAITVADAISDLQVIYNDENEEEMLYQTEPKTRFQALINFLITHICLKRSQCNFSTLRLFKFHLREMNCRADDVLTDHICKRLTGLNWVRVTYIPRKPVGDWPDIPNIEVELPNGTYTNKP